MFYGRAQFLGPKRSVHFSKGTLHPVKIRERKGPSPGVIQKCELHDQNLRTDHRTKPCNKNDAPAEMHGKWWEMSISSEIRTKPRSTHLHKFGHYQRHLRRSLRKSTPAPSSKKPEERWCVVGSGASMHMLSREDLNSAELNTVRESRKQHLSQPMGKCKHWGSISVRLRPRFIRDGTNPRGHGLQSCRRANSAKNRDIHMSGSAVKSHGSPKKGRQLKTEMEEEVNATRRTLYRLLCQDYRQVFPARLQVRLPHSYRRTHLMILRRVSNNTKWQYKHSGIGKGVARSYENQKHKKK